MLRPLLQTAHSAVTCTITTGTPLREELLKKRSSRALKTGRLRDADFYFLSAAVRSLPKEAYQKLLKFSPSGHLRDLTIQDEEASVRFKQITANVPDTTLYSLYQYIVKFGDFVTAQQLFENTLARALHSAEPPPPNSVPLKLRCACAAGDSSMIFGLLKSGTLLPAQRRMFRDAGIYSRLLLGTLKGTQDPLPQHITESPLTQYLTNKNVWLVGPLTNMHLEDAERYNTIVKLNSKPNPNASTNEYLGPADIVFTNNEFLHTPDGSALLNPSLRAPLVVHRNKRLRTTSAEHLFYRDRPNHLLLNGHLNMAQWAAFTILSFSPKSLRLTGFPLFSLQKLYNSDHYSATKSSAETARVLRGHDLLSNFRLLQNLYNAGLFACDEMTSTALSKPFTEYASDINAQFGCHPIDATTP